MQPLIRHALLAGLCAGLVACSSGPFRDRSPDYLQARASEPLQVPAGLDSYNMSQALVIPPTDAPLPDPGTEFEVPRPRPLALQTAATEQVEFKQSEDGRMWLWVEARPESVWPQVRLFWESRNITLERANPRQGVMETGWLEARQADKRQRFRVEVQQGLQPRSTEIHIRQVLRPTSQQQVEQWPERPDNPELAQQLLAELSLFLREADPETRSVSLLAQKLVRAERARLVSENEQPVLRLELDFNRAWSAVGDALRRRLREPGRQLMDINRSRGLYYILYVPRDELKPGLLGQLIQDEDERLEPYRYQIRLQKSNGMIDVTVLQDQQPVAVETSRQILTQIKEALL